MDFLADCDDSYINDNSSVQTELHDRAGLHGRSVLSKSTLVYHRSPSQSYAITSHCCVKSYTPFWKEIDILCTSSIKTLTNYNFQIWSLWSTSGDTTSKSEVYDNGTPQAHIFPLNGQNLSYSPLFVRASVPGKAAFVPTQTANISGLVWTGSGAPVEAGGAADSKPLPGERGVNLGLILGISLPLGLTFVATIAYILWYYSSRKKTRRRERNILERKALKDGEGQPKSEYAIYATETEAYKPELQGSRPEYDISYPMLEKAELNGVPKSGGDVVTSLEKLQVDGRAIDDDLGQERWLELDGQVGRRGVADTENDRRERERRVMEMDAMTKGVEDH